MAGQYFYKIFVFIFIIQLTLSYKLNVPRILLPIFNDFSAKFVLEATEGGCYKWTTTRSDVITLTQIDADADFCCSSKVIVSAITKEFARNIAVVLAEDVHTQRILRCDVIVDVIDNLEIVTTTRELFMEEAPEVFEIRAYDDQGNEFSSLEGVEFDWNIMCMGANPDVVVLRFMGFAESTYEIPPTVQAIEEENKQGHIVLLEGVKTGAAKVSANLPQPEYKHIKPCSIQLSVIANLLILPADAYIMVGDTVAFQIIHMNNGQMEVIELPDAQFYLEVENKELGTSEKETGEITGLAEGRTRVVLHDRNVNEDDPSFKLPAATLNIVAPAYMVLSCMPHRNWAILKSLHHDIIAEVYSSNDNKIYLGSGAQVHTQVGDSFHVQERSQNGSWLTGWGIEIGTVPVQAVLESVVHPTLGTFKIEKEITAQAQLQVFSPIILTPCEVVLPWDPQRRPKYEKQVRATGGDGRFLWSSSNHSVGVVTQSGKVRTHTSGYFEVSAAMIRNHHNRETAVFLILLPTRLEIVEFVMEAEIGSIIYIHVALYADKHSKENEQPSQIPFTDCQELPFEVKFSDQSFSYNKSAVIPPVGISCANIAVIGTKVAISTVTVSYNIEDKLLEDTVTISTFKPLKVLKPNVCEIVLAVGTSISVLFTGGPQTIPGKEYLHKRTISIADESVVSASEESAENPEEILLNVVCLQLGESSVKLTVSNSPSLPNSKNQESCATIKVVCGEPKSLSLKPETQAANTEGCPMDLSSSRIVIHSYKDVELDVIVMDDQGRQFLNVSSLKFDWNVKPEELGELKHSDGVFAKTIMEKGVVFTNKTYQIVSPKSQTGSMEVTAAIMSYKVEELLAQGISLESENLQDSVTAAIHLFLVDDTVVTPNSVSVFNHPGNRKLIAVSQGSGYFEMALSTDDIAQVKYIDSTRQIEIVPIKDGHLRITLVDLCLSSEPSVVEANIVSVNIIRVEMSDKVEIGRCISCIVKLYDENDNLLCVPDLNMVNVEHHLQREIAKIKKLKEDPDNPWGPGEIHYIITGIELGESKLSFSIGETSSAPIELQVFSPLKVTPRNTTLIVGSILQFNNKGGPLPDCNVEYASEDIDIADVNIAGLVQAKALGHSQITARAVGINPTTGLKIVYSQDTVDLFVVPLAGIKIGAPLMRFQVDTTVPAWATGIPEYLTPIILGTVDPPIKFEWNVDDEQVLNVHGLFKEHGIEYSAEDDISVRLTGLAPGLTKVHLNAIIPGATAGNGDSSEVVYSTSIDVEVFERLTVVNPNNVVGSFLLMAPHCTIQIQTNLDETNKLAYSLPGPEPPSDPDNHKSLTLPNSIVTLSSSGLLRSHGAFGKTMILVTALDEYGLKQSLSLIVEVKPVHYMLLNVIANWKIDAPPEIETLPSGTEFQLHITYHDNTGAQFTAGTAELGIRSSRFDLAKIRAGADNSTVYVALKKPGSTMIKVWADGYHKTADYVKLRVGQSLSPTGQLNTGDIICACTAVVSTTDLQGSWSSSDRNLLSINSETGVGHVEGVRSGSVSIGHSLHPSASLQVQVVPSNQIIMMPDSSEPLINSRDAPVYQIPLVLSNEQNPNKTKNVVCECSCEVEMDEDGDYPFTCHLEFMGTSCGGVKANDVFSIAPGFDSKKGQYVCNILPGTATSIAISVIKDNVSVWAQLVGGSVQAAPIELQFIPAIFVEPNLYLENEQGILSVHGLDNVLAEVTVEPADSSLFQVDGPDRSKANVLNFNVQLLDYHWKLDELGEAMNLIVTSKVTKEVVNVHVKTGSPSQTKIRTSRCSVDGSRGSVDGSRGSITSMDDTQYTLIILTAMFAVLVIIYLSYAYCFQPVVNVNVSPDRSLLPGNGSPRSSFTSGQCAYVQYMRRTQGATPNGTPRNRASCSREPVYGDPNSFYATSPETRRNNRSFM